MLQTDGAQAVLPVAAVEQGYLEDLLVLLSGELS